MRPRGGGASAGLRGRHERHHNGVRSREGHRGGRGRAIREGGRRVEPEINDASTAPLKRVALAPSGAGMRVAATTTG